MSLEASSPHHSENPASATEQAEQVKLNTQAELNALNHDISLSSLPSAARDYLAEQELTNDLEAQTLIYLHHVKAAEFGGLQNIPDAFWPVILADCISVVRDNTEIDFLNKEIGSEKQENDQKREKITSLKDRITGNLKGPDKAGQLSELIASVESATDFQEDEKHAALKHLRLIALTLSDISAVLPHGPKRDALNDIVNLSSLDLSASGIDAVFVPIMSHVEASNIFSEDDKRRLRMIVTGSQAQNMLNQTIINETGETVTAWPEDAPMEIRPGISMYSDSNANHYLRAEYKGHITNIDMTGVSGEVLGRYLEALSFIHDLESFGAGGIFQSIYQIDFSLLGNEGFDMLKINQILNIMGKVFGGFEDADGDIRREGDRIGLIRHFARLLNPVDEATGFGEDRSQSNKVILDLGLKHENGTPNWKQIDQLGNFVQMSYLSGEASYEGLKAYLTA